jgi:hypothetical protein
MALLLSLFLFASCNDDDNDNDTPTLLTDGLTASNLIHYSGANGDDLAQITYFALAADSDAYKALPESETAKVTKIKANTLHSSLFTPDQLIAGREASGTLTVQGDSGLRIQNVSLKVPDNWNGDLVVGGTPGMRNEYASWAILAPWLLNRGYAVVAGNKGIPGGIADMLSGTHPSQHWGMMMLDLADWSRQRLEDLQGRKVAHTYAMGLSNGGYQVRRALELDHEAVNNGAARLFDGGLDWSGTYSPDKRVLDTDNDGQVSPQEYGDSNSLIPSIDRATLAMEWAYPTATSITATQYDRIPRFPDAQDAVTASGYTTESAIFWGAYNTISDAYKAIPGYEIFKGVGYYNLISHVYRADLRGDTATEAGVYSSYNDPANPDAAPPVYAWLTSADKGNWTEESVEYALKTANTGEFSVPMISLHGTADGLLGTVSNGTAYGNAVEKYGNGDLHRFFLIQNAGHVDAHADGGLDYDFNGQPGDENAADELTPMQAYAQRSFDYLVDWVEKNVLPPDSTTVTTSPGNDVTDPDTLSW